MFDFRFYFTHRKQTMICFLFLASSKPLPIAAGCTVKLGGTVATVGFPDSGLQGFAPKVLAHGHHGGNRCWEVELRPGDDPPYFQISVVFADGHRPGGAGAGVLIW